MATTTMHCAICLEPVQSSLIFKTTNRCEHSFCRNCIARYITESTNSGRANVCCPGLNCYAMLDPVYCKQLVSTQGFVRWCDLSCKSSVLRFSSCYCPNLNCQELIISECGGKGNMGRFKCSSCSQSGCFWCARPWVEGHRCSNTHRDSANIHLLERLAKRKQWKLCPVCNIYVERRGGCKTISCICGTRFCYGCGRISDLPCACRDASGADREFSIAERIYLAILVFALLALVVLVLHQILRDYRLI